MTSAASPGFEGIFKVSTTALIQIQSCEIQANGETYDVTVMSGLSTPQWKAFIGGLKDWTLKVVGFYDFVNDAVQTTLWNALGTSVAISFSPNTGTNTFSGNAILTGVPMKFVVNAADSVEFDFQGTGALSYA